MKLFSNRYVILVVAVLMQMCLGATYSWSVFVGSIKELTGLGQGAVQLPFTVFYIVFPASLLFSGIMVTKLGPRKCAMIGGILFGGGWIMASFGYLNFAFTIMGVGLMSGLGLGFAYLVPLAVGVQRFPNHKGLVSGIALAGFGGGAAIVTQLAGAFLKHGATAFQTLRLFGLAFLVIITLSGSIMTFSGEYHLSKTAALPVKRVAGSGIFWLLFLTLFTGLIAGFTVNTNMTKLYQGSNVQVGVTAVALFAIMNALGRVTWGFLFDRMAAPTAIKMNLLSQAILFLAGPWLLQSAGGFTTFAIIAGFNYGGLLVNHASASARYWGPEHISQVYGWLSAANIPASLAPLFAGYAYDRCGIFTVPRIVSGVTLLVVMGYVHCMLPSADKVSRTCLIEGTES